MIKFLLTLKHKFMTKHKANKSAADEIKKSEELAEKNSSTSETNEEPTIEETFEEEEHEEEEEIDHQQFALDMMQAFMDSTAKLKGMQTQLNFPPEHHISLQVVENERLQAIIEKLKPTE